MRILQVCPDSYVEFGGVSVHIKNISEKLVKRHDVTVFATNDKMLYPKSEVHNGVKVERFRCYAPNNAYMFTWEMPFQMRRVEFDVVHAHGYHAFPFHLANFAKCKKFIVTPHFHGAGHSTFRNALINTLKPFGSIAMKKAERIVAVSTFEKSLICEKFRVNKEKVTVIPNGVNYNEFAGLKKQKRDFRSILYVSYLTSYKGPQYLIEVLPKLPDDVILEIVGRGPLVPWLTKRARELRIEDRVRFYGLVDRRDLLQKYVDADVFVLLSLHEAYSIVVAEALSAGTRCVLSNSSGLTEWIDNRTCFGVNFPIDLRELTNRINFVLKNDFDKGNISKWTGSKILAWSEVAKRLENIYEE